MAIVFPYKVQANCRAYGESEISAKEAAYNWNVFHKNPESQGLWIVDSLTGYLRINSLQKGLSGRYSAQNLDKQNYRIESELIISSENNAAVGLVFRYQDNFHFYYVLWDGGGYNYGEDSLRLYKVINDEHKLLASAKVGYWKPREITAFDADIKDNVFSIYIHGEEVIHYVDDEKPYMKGSYGPCADRQVASWKRFYVKGDFDFMIESNLEAELEVESYDYKTSSLIAPDIVEDIMKKPISDYLDTHNFVEDTFNVKSYIVDTDFSGATVYFDTTPVSRTTTNGSSKIRGYLIIPKEPPTPPSNFKGELDDYSIIWSWKDNSVYEHGFEILDENNQVIATVGRDVTTWEEDGLEEGETYTRKVRSYNISGKSAASNSATITIEVVDTNLYYTPIPPVNLRGMTKGIDAINWYWDKVDKADYYQLYDAATKELIYSGASNFFKATGLTPNTMYRYYVVAVNVAGTSSPSTEAIAFTDALPVVDELPPEPINFRGETIDEKTILWTWEPPDVGIEIPEIVSEDLPDLDGEEITDETLNEEPYEDIETDEDIIEGEERSEEEIERDRLLEAYRYRIYDANGEVLYEAPAGIYEWREENLTPSTSYTHYVKSFTDNNVESIRSNYAYATTDSEYVDPGYDPDENNGDETPLEWPVEVDYEPYETEPTERIEAFHTGIGDNLDLKVRRNGQKPKYQTGRMRRTLAEEGDGDGSDGSEGKDKGKPIGDHGWPGIDSSKYSGIGGSLDELDWDGWSPGNSLGGGHGDIGYAGYTGAGTESIGHGGSAGGTTDGEPGYMTDDELGLCAVDSPNEKFSFTTQAKGTVYSDINIYPRRDFKFRFKGTGMEGVKTYVNDLLARVFIMPRVDMPVEVSATAQVPETYNYKYKIGGEVRSLAEFEYPYSIMPMVSATTDFSGTGSGAFINSKTKQDGYGSFESEDEYVRIESPSGITNIFDGRRLGKSNGYTISCNVTMRDTNINSDGITDRKFAGISFGIRKSGGKTQFIAFGLGMLQAGYTTGYDYHGNPISSSFSNQRKIGSVYGKDITNFSTANITNMVYPTTQSWTPYGGYNLKVKVDKDIFGNFKATCYLNNAIVTTHENITPGAFGLVLNRGTEATFSNISYTVGESRTVYADYDNYVNGIVNQNNIGFDNKKAASNLTLKEMAAPLVDKLKDELSDDFGLNKNNITFSQMNYGASLVTPLSNTNLTSYNLNSSEKVYVYLDDNIQNSTNIYEYTPVSFDSDTLLSTVTDEGSLIIHYSIGEATASIENYLMNNNINKTDWTLKTLEPIAISPELYFTTQINGVDSPVIDPTDLNAYYSHWTTAITHYDGSKVLHYSDYRKKINSIDTDDWVDTNDIISDIVLYNPSGTTYTGPKTNIKYSIKALDTGYDVGFNKYGAKNFNYASSFSDDIDDDEKVVRSDVAPTVMYKVLKLDSIDITYETKSPLNEFIDIYSITPGLSAYPDAKLAIRMLDGADIGPWIAFSSDMSLKTISSETANEYHIPYDEEENTIYAKPGETLITIGTYGGLEYREFYAYSKWYVGSVNGAMPVYGDGDGKQDLIVPISIDSPSNITFDTWYVEVDDPMVSFDIFNGTTSDMTKYPNDKVRFYSNVPTVITIGREWYGPEYEIEYEYNICGTTPVKITTRLIAPGKSDVFQPFLGLPSYDPVIDAPDDDLPEIVIGHFSLKDNETIVAAKEADVEVIEDELVEGPLFQAKETTRGIKWETIVTSKNPNVALVVDSEPNYSAEGGIFLPLKVKAYIINPVQTPWNPLIHNGYYYLNQKEHFLYSNSSIKGKYVEKEGYQTAEFPYSVKVYCERFVKGDIKTWTDDYRIDYKGTASLIDLDSSFGDIMIRKDRTGNHYATGVYTSEIKSMPKKAKSWGTVNWDAEVPSDSQLKVETSSMDVNTGTWNGWVEATNGDTIQSPLSTSIRYRATLTAGTDKIVSDKVTTYTLSTDWDKGEFDKTKGNFGMLEIKSVNTNENGTWITNIIDLGENIEDMGTVSWSEDSVNVNGSALIVETITADTVNGPWDETGEQWTPISNITLKDGVKVGKIDSAKRRYLKVRYTLTRGKVNSLNVQQTKTTTYDFGNELVYYPNAEEDTNNILIKDGSIIQNNADYNAVYVSSPFIFKRATKLLKVLLNAAVPKGGSISIYTMTADNVSEFDTLMADQTNWKPVTGTLDIQSPVKEYLKVKLVMKSGEAEPTQKDITTDSTEEFESYMGNIMNVLIDNGAIVIENPMLPASFESTAYDFNHINAWINLRALTVLNDGNITIYTSTSDNPYNGWEEWKPLGSNNTIESTVKRYIRYRVEMSAIYTIESDVYKPGVTEEILEEESDNIALLSDKLGFTQADATKDAYFISKPIHLSNIYSYKALSFVNALSVNGYVIVSTRTSTDKINWTEWSALDESNQITSVSQDYIQYKIEIQKGYGTSTKKILLDSASLSSSNIIDESKNLILTSVYSDVLSFSGEVTGLDTLSFTKYMPIGSAISIHTASSDYSDTLYVEDPESLLWTATTYDEVNDKYIVNSEPGEFIRYKISIKPGYSEIKEKEYSNDISGININGEYSSPVISVNDVDKFITYTTLKLAVTKKNPEYTNEAGESVIGVNAPVECFVKVAETEEGLQDATEVSIGTIDDGVLTFDATVLDVKPYLQYRIVVGSGDIVPTVNAFEISTKYQTAESPIISNVAIATTPTGYRPYKPSTIEKLELNYDYRYFNSPRVEKVILSALTTPKLPVTINEITASADVFNWVSPTVKNLNVVNKIFTEQSCSPILHSINLSATTEDSTELENYTVPMSGNVLSNKQVQQVSTRTMKQMVDSYFKDYKINEDGLTRKNYEIFTATEGIELSVRNDDEIYYQNGNSEVFAKTTVTNLETQYSQKAFQIDENNQVIVEPVPQQGAPVVIKDASNTEMKQVVFFDENDRPTLWYSGTGCTDGTREFLLNHADFDPSTLEIEVDEIVDQPYTKLIEGEDYIVTNNVVTFRKMYPEDIVVLYKYKIKHSFMVDYNYNVKLGQALITLHEPILNEEREVGIVYETNQDSAYYKATELDLNPMRNALNEGFIYLTDEYYPAAKLEIAFNPNMLAADGRDQTTIRVIAHDKYGNPVVGDQIRLSVTDGSLDIRNRVTDSNGMITAIYTSSVNAGDVTVTAEDLTTPLEQRDVIHLRSVYPQPRVEIELSNNSITPDGIETVKATVRVSNASLNRAVAVDAYFEAIGAILDAQVLTTNYEGEAFNYIRVRSVPQNGIITLKVLVPELNVEGYANLLVKEVVNFV